MGGAGLPEAKRLSRSEPIYLISHPEKSDSMEAFLRAVQGLPSVLVAQYNHLVTPWTTTPNDANFASQWHLKNTGQSGGTVGADIDAASAWDITTGGLTAAGDTIVVAIVDGGVQLAHPDLSPNQWINADEIPGNSIDDDANGYIDDVYGWNAYNNNGTIPNDNHARTLPGLRGRGEIIQQVVRA